MRRFEKVSEARFPSSAVLEFIRFHHQAMRFQWNLHGFSSIFLCFHAFPFTVVASSMPLMPWASHSSWYFELIFRWKWPIIAARMLTMGTVANMANVSFQLVTYN